MKDCCPRCLSPWDDQLYCLTRCGMRKVKRRDELYLYICQDIINSGDLLVWYMPENYCAYFRTEYSTTATKLPYVKFDLEAPKLKLYLPFS